MIPPNHNHVWTSRQKLKRDVRGKEIVQVKLEDRGQAQRNEKSDEREHTQEGRRGCYAIVSVTVHQK